MQFTLVAYINSSEGMQLVCDKCI